MLGPMRALTPSAPPSQLHDLARNTERAAPFFACAVGGRGASAASPSASARSPPPCSSSAGCAGDADPLTAVASCLRRLGSRRLRHHILPLRDDSDATLPSAPGPPPESSSSPLDPTCASHIVRSSHAGLVPARSFGFRGFSVVVVPARTACAADSHRSVEPSSPPLALDPEVLNDAPAPVSPSSDNSKQTWLASTWVVSFTGCFGGRAAKLRTGATGPRTV
mmetsp:Transcript_28076/g.53470  ORF Transcript_28076/g.53470 Transcript_28076/m.53470 type:complete len:222 (+) Transcript_28076:1401-2066(+)